MRGQSLDASVAGLTIIDGVFLEITPGGLLARVAGPGDRLTGAGYWATAGRAGRPLSESAELIAEAGVETELRQRVLERRIDCVAFHSAASRLAGLLGAIHRRSGEDRIIQTQQEMATLTGVRRATVNEIFQGLQFDRIVAINRGQIRILAPERLSQAACGCDKA